MVGPGLAGALCVVIDLPGSDGLQALEALRAMGNCSPAILIADADCEIPPERLDEARALDVLRRPVDLTALLGWIECVCAAHMVLARRRAA